MEIWKDIQGYEGVYKVSIEGAIKRMQSGKLLKYTVALGYYKVVLCTNSLPKCFLLHRIIAAAFIPNPENKPCVNHIDGNKKNNQIANLEWVSHKENIRHAFANGLNAIPFGEKNHRSKLTETQVKQIPELVKQGIKKSAIAKTYGVTPAAITRITKGNTWNKVTNNKTAA